MVRVHGQAGDQSPEGKPREANEQHLLVAEDVSESSSREDEGSDRETVGGHEPAQFSVFGDFQIIANDVQDGNGPADAGLGGKLRHGDDGDKKNLSHKRHFGDTTALLLIP